MGNPDQPHPERSIAAFCKAVNDALHGRLLVGCTACQGRGCDNCEMGTTPMGFTWTWRLRGGPHD